MITEIHIFDFDGTLVDSSHRYRTDESGLRIDLEHWRANECHTLEDSLLPLMDKFNRICEDANKYALIATARIWCNLSKTFAIANNVRPNGLVARESELDRRGGAALKITHVNRLLNLKQFRKVDTIHVYEDNYTYLISIMDCYRLKGYNVVGHYIPSKQGH